jgi:diguanylate cyclase (GGDEF)-like protein/PAS domain S-box-containing protein
MMSRLSVPAKLACCLACLTISVLLFARTWGLLPDSRAEVLSGRSALCEAMAVHFSLMADCGETGLLQTDLESFARRNPDVRSLAIRSGGKILAEVGPHATNWQSKSDRRSAETQMSVPIHNEDSGWGTLEATFTPIGQSGWWLSRSAWFLLLAGYVVSCYAVAYYLYLRKLLTQLDPQKVIPSRVKMALDTMAEGLVILDDEGHIMLANAAFAKTIHEDTEHLIGRNVKDLAWEAQPYEATEEPLPWSITLEQGIPQLGAVVYFAGGSDERLTFLVNSTPIHGQDGESRGALVSFDDITQLEKSKLELEKNRLELSEMLDSLRQSTDEIRRQNRELEQLATRDHLTGCYNRRSFFERFNSLWKSALRHNHPLSCVMVDVDHFKSVNDNHGHSVGDQVLQRVGQILLKMARESDVVCRYGGEEFAILLPYTTMDEAAEAAERIRFGLASAIFPNLSITASLGVSAITFGAIDPQGMLDQADKCLYLAKRYGRNRVVRWDEIPEDLEMDETKFFRSRPEDDNHTAIPFQAITALISALAYRDVATAEHSRRVADLCVATGEGLMSLSACYVLENAALLHDIGKIGVPDSILLKPGPLADEEWQIMRRQERIGVEIIRASFDSRELVSIVSNHQAWFAGTPHAPHLPRGEDIPIGARILNIVNAYDAMTSRQVYRDPRPQEEAFAELRRYAGTQFDPALVERFIAIARVRQHFPAPAVSGVSQETALQFGLQIERLMAALDNQDIQGLHALADRLHAMAQKHQVSEIARKASELARHTQSQHEPTDVLLAANELIELCRSTQSSYVRVAGDV